MAIPAEKARYTFADVLEWENGEQAEIIDGEVTMMGTPSSMHQEISVELTRQLANYLEGKQCRVYHAPFAVRLFERAGDAPEDVDTVVEPDLSVVCDKSKIDKRGCKGAPDLIIEILSPSTRQHDCLIKYNLYQQAGVKEYWIVDPDKKVVLVHKLVDGQYHAPDAYTAEDSIPVGVLEDCAVDLTAVFSGL